MKLFLNRAPIVNTKLCFFKANGNSPSDVNRSTDERLANDMAEKVEARMASTSLSLNVLKAQIRPSLTVKTFHGSNLRLRNDSGTIIARMPNDSAVKFTGETKVTKDASGQSIDTDGINNLINRHLWFQVNFNGKIGWASAEYLQGDLKAIVEPEPPKEEEPEPIACVPECRNGFIVLVHPESGEVETVTKTPCGETVTPPPESAPAPEPLIGTTGDDRITSTTRQHGRISPLPNQQYDESIERDLGSDHLIESYEDGSIEALMAAIDSIPVADRPDVLGEFFDKLGLSNPAQAAAAMRELSSVIETDRGVLEALVSQGFDEKIATAPNADARSFWEAQKGFFEVSQGTLTPVMAQQQMRNAYNQAKHLNTANLSPAEEIMQAELITNLENYMKQSLAIDMIQTVANNLNTGLEEHEELAELMALAVTNPDAVADKLNNVGLLEFQDRDYEVAFAANNINQALQYLLNFQYPVDIAAGVAIGNPIRYYLKQLETSNGVITPVPDVTNPVPTFISFARELELYNDYNSGNEDMGTGSIWNNLDGSGVALGNSFETTGSNFEVGLESSMLFGLLEGNDSGNGIYGLSDEIFSSANLFEHNGDMGAVDRLNIEKIRNAYANGHYDEARSLAIELIQHKLTAPTQTEINTRRNELLAKKGNKIRAQVRENLLNETPPIDPSTNITVLMIPKSDGSGNHTDLDELISDKTRVILNETAIIQLYGEKAAKLSASGLNQNETLAHNILNKINGVGVGNMSAENADFAADIAKTIAEIIIIQMATAGTGAFIAGAAGGTRVANIGSRTMALSRGFTTQRTAFAMRQGRLLRNTKVGNAFAQTRLAGGIRNLSQSTHWSSKAGRLALNSTAFVEGQHMLHGGLVNPLSAEGAYEIGAMALTFGVLGGASKFMRGQTGLAGTPLVGKYINSASQFVGNNTQRLVQSGRPGYLASSSVEIGAEIGALHLLSNVQEKAAVYLYDATGGAVGFTENQAQAMAETNAWRRWGHEAGVVLGLRTWRATNQKLQQSGNKLVPRGERVARPQSPSAKESLAPRTSTTPKVNITHRETTQIQFVKEYSNASSGTFIVAPRKNGNIDLLNTRTGQIEHANLPKDQIASYVSAGKVETNPLIEKAFARSTDVLRAGVSTLPNITRAITRPRESFKERFPELSKSITEYTNSIRTQEFSVSSLKFNRSINTFSQKIQRIENRIKALERNRNTTLKPEAKARLEGKINEAKLELQSLQTRKTELQATRKQQLETLAAGRHRVIDKLQIDLTRLENPPRLSRKLTAEARKHEIQRIEETIGKLESQAPALNKVHRAQILELKTRIRTLKSTPGLPDGHQPLSDIITTKGNVKSIEITKFELNKTFTGKIEGDVKIGKYTLTQDSGGKLTLKEPNGSIRELHAGEVNTSLQGLSITKTTTGEVSITRTESIVAPANTPRSPRRQPETLDPARTRATKMPSDMYSNAQGTATLRTSKLDIGKTYVTQKTSDQTIILGTSTPSASGRAQSSGIRLVPDGKNGFNVEYTSAYKGDKSITHVSPKNPAEFKVDLTTTIKVEVSIVDGVQSISTTRNTI